jgi:transcriptional regulator with XRE-family HTH domain
MNNDIGGRLIELRQVLGLTQKVFGEKIHLSKGYITSLEKSRQSLNDRLVSIICDTFGVNVEWLKTGSGGMFQDPEDAQSAEIIAMFNQLNPDFQKFIVKQLKQLLAINHNHHPDKTP